MFSLEILALSSEILRDLASCTNIAALVMDSSNILTILQRHYPKTWERKKNRNIVFTFFLGGRGREGIVGGEKITSYK